MVATIVRGYGCALVCAAALALALQAAADDGFPFDRELMLDAKPMRGSKRVPLLEVAAGGEATIDLWCNSGKGEVVVAGAAITVTLGPMSTNECSPERARADEEMAAALSQVTAWRRDGGAIVLVGPQVLRFRPTTN